MTNKNKKSPGYVLGSESQLQWRKKYSFFPRGIGFFEMGVVALDDAAMNAYNIAKSTYQIHPEVFNLNYLAKSVGISKKEVKERLLKLYDKRIIMYAGTSNIQAAGYGLYYWLVKLKEGTSAKEKKQITDWIQNKDSICTSYKADGDFDYFGGNHMRVLDNLLEEVIDPLKNNSKVDSVYLCPIRRNIRESHVNTSDALPENYRQLYWGKGQIEKLAKIQDKVDLVDLKIIEAFNKKRPIENVFNFDSLSKLSGLDGKQMKKDIAELVDKRKVLLPIMYLHAEKLGLTNHMFTIRLFQMTADYRKAEIADELSEIAEFNTVYEFTDSMYDISVWAYNELSNIKKLKEKIQSYSEVEDIKEADIPQQLRRWSCRTDDYNDYWEETVMTDDFLQDYQSQKSFSEIEVKNHNENKNS